MPYLAHDIGIHNIDSYREGMFVEIPEETIPFNHRKTFL
jgi:hypothetical protein